LSTLLTASLTRRVPPDGSATIEPDVLLAGHLGRL